MPGTAGKRPVEFRLQRVEVCEAVSGRLVAEIVG